MGFPSLRSVLHQELMAKASGKSAKQVAHALGIRYNTLMSEVSGQAGHKLSCDQLLPIMDYIDSDAVLHAMARARGGVYVPLVRDMKVLDGSSLGQAVLSSVKEFGEYASESAASIADGRIPRDQLDRMEKEGQEAMTSIMSFLEMARRVHTEQYGR
ncbi:MAG: phage regulatory CII family protein [Pseudomonadota bacterium]